MDNDIHKFIKELEKEIQETEVDIERETQLLRLQEAAAKYEGEDKLISSEELVEYYKTHPQETGITLGWYEIDKILTGFHLEQLIVLSGITKHGKTSFALEIASRLKKENPLFLPFEESAEELIYKFLERGVEVPHFYTPRVTLDNKVQWIEKKIIEAKAKFDTKIVFIDHLGYIVPHAENLAQETGFVVRELKSIAKRWDVIIVLLCHLTKVEIDKHPNLKDLRDSMAIGQEADTVMFIWRQTLRNRKTGEVEITNNVNLSVQANRRTGKTGNVKMVYEDNHYYEKDWKDGEEEFDF